MDIYEAIGNRHSVRAYKDAPVEQDRLERVLSAGRDAPSARNRQAWKFIVVRDGQLRKLLAKASCAFLAQAPVVIAVVGLSPQEKMFCGVPTDPVDCSIAIDHMTLAAVAEGLGTCWIGHFEQDECRRILGVPPSAKIIELLPLGHPADQPHAKHRKDLSEVVCYEKFSG